MPFLGVYPKELKAGTQTNTWMWMLTVMLSDYTAKRGNNLLSIEGWTDKHTLEYYSAMKRDAVLTDATRRNFEDMLSERRQTQKVPCWVASFIGRPMQLAGCQGGEGPQGPGFTRWQAGWCWLHNTTDVQNVLSRMPLSGLFHVMWILTQ